MPDSELVHELDGRLVPTEAGIEHLARVTTDPTGPVYAFTYDANLHMVSAAMARLSRNPNDLRTTYLNEFVGEDDEVTIDLLRRVVVQYSDDSVKQLIFIPLGYEGASNLLTKLIEWGRLAAYLEQSTRYIYFDEKDERGRYRYYIPNELRGNLLSQYTASMDGIFELYSDGVRRLTEFVRNEQPRPDINEDPAGYAAWPAATRAAACDAMRAVLPAATKSTVGIVGSAQAVENMIINLLASPLPEANRAGKALLNEVRKVLPVFMENTENPKYGGGVIAHKKETRTKMSEWAARLPKSSQYGSCAVRLLSYWPRDEKDLMAAVLFSEADHSYEEIAEWVKAQSDSTLEEILVDYIGDRTNRRQKPDRAIEEAHFTFEIVDEYATFRDLQRHRMVDGFRWQRLNPYYGFEIPELVVRGGLEEVYRSCFESSRALFELMDREGFREEAQYAICMGFRMRYTFTVNLRELFHFLELRSAPEGHPGYRKIAIEMHKLLQEVYPKMAAAMTFINRRHDDPLVRMASGRRAETKLADLENSN